MYGLMMPVSRMSSSDYVWDASTAISIVNNYGATFTMASTPFLADLTDTVATAGTGVRACRRSYVLGPDPSALLSEPNRHLAPRSCRRGA